MSANLEQLLKLVPTDVLAKRLLQKRKDANITQETAADSIRVSRSTMVNIEQGTRQVNLNEVLELSALYSVEPSDLLQHDDEGTDLTILFRTLLEQNLGLFKDREPLDQAIDILQKFALSSLELENKLQKPTTLYVRQIYQPDRRRNPEEQGERIARQERQRLGLGDEPVLNLREILERQFGTRIYYYPMDAKISGIYGFAPRLGTCIGINSLHPVPRQNHTLAHEWGHALTHPVDQEVTVMKDREPRSFDEKLAFGFAMEFTLPAAGVREAIDEVFETGEPTLGDLLRIANRYEVSFEALLRRLVSIGLMAKNDATRLVKMRVVKEGQRELGIEQPRELSALDQLLLTYPEQHLYNAVAAYTQELYSEEDVRKNYLDNVTSQTFLELVRRLTERVELADDGRVIRYQLLNIGQTVALRRK